jgi:hypothetical protein
VSLAGSPLPLIVAVGSREGRTVGGSPKMVLTLSYAAQTALNGRALYRIDAARDPGWATRRDVPIDVLIDVPIDVLIDAAHEHHCLDADGTHRIRHTATCGCGAPIGHRSLAVQGPR